MGVRFNIEEVLEMAAQIERNGGVFYRAAAKNSESGRELLLRIAEQEDQHLALFEGMKKEVSKREARSTAFDPDGEASLYLKALADGHVFDLKGNEPASMLKGNEDLSDIVKIAIQAEKDSIVFFLGMKELVPENLGGSKMDALIKEEMGHITWLNSILKDKRSA